MEYKNFSCLRHKVMQVPKSPYIEINHHEPGHTYLAVSPGNRLPFTANIFPVVDETKLSVWRAY